MGSLSSPCYSEAIIYREMERLLEKQEDLVNEENLQKAITLLVTITPLIITGLVYQPDMTLCFISYILIMFGRYIYLG